MSTIQVPDNIAEFGVITGDELRSKFRYGMKGPLQPGMQVARLSNAEACAFGHIDDETALRAARFALGSSAVLSVVGQHWVLFTLRPFDGRTNPDADWWVTPVPDGTPDAVPVTVVGAVAS